MFKYLFFILLYSVSISAAPPDKIIQNQIYLARDKVMPALVNIQPITKNYNTGELEKQTSIGSGVIFHKDGYVVTNYHVAGKAERIICTLSDKEIVQAEYIGGDPLTDLSIIKLDLSNYNGKISVAEFGDSDSVEVGQYVIAMGSPLALSRSLSVGVVSTKDRYISSNARLPSGEPTGRYNLWIQTDAAINPGNSGGPLVNLDGKIIGINSRANIFANNIGFAIPVNVVKKVTSEVLSKGKVTRSWIGLHCQALQELENYFGANINSGVLISSIDANSPAEKSFLKAGDIILEVNNETVSARFIEELPIFYAKIASFEPESEILLKVLRQEEIYSFKVTTKELGAALGDDYECKDWGFTVKGVTRQMQIEQQLDDTLGVYVAGVKNISPADNGGLRRRDIVLKINDVFINNLNDFIQNHSKISKTEKLKTLLTVKRGGSKRFVFLDVNKKIGDSTDAP